MIRGIDLAPPIDGVVERKDGIRTALWHDELATALAKAFEVGCLRPYQVPPGARELCAFTEDIRCVTIEVEGQLVAKIRFRRVRDVGGWGDEKR
jgi:hypothetical protein